MMKTLYILRHAKSSWSDSGLADFDRPLKTRGLEDAAFIGGVMFENQIQPALILSSPAKRAKQTAILVKESGMLNAPIRYEEKIYEASPHTLVKIISEIEENAENVLLVGHNPGMENLVKFFTGEDVGFPTAGFAVVSLWINEWRDVGANCGQLELFVSPAVK